MNSQPDEFGQILDAYEQEIEDHFTDDFYPPEKAAAEMQRLRNAALNSLKKDSRINIRLNESVIIKLKNIAKHHEIKYQTLIGNVLYKFVQEHANEAYD